MMDQHQGLQAIRVYPGANATFDLYRDEGTPADERSGGQVTVLHWDERTRRFTHTGARAWSVPDATLVKVMHASN
jgi:alpha-D-xyloside xylohydrolase